MSLQESTFSSARVMDNEIVKASDFEFAFEKVVENVSLATQMILESEQDFVINGKVLPYQGMNVQISPIYGVCKSTGVPFGRTESAVMEYGFEESTSGRVDIIEVQGDWETYDNQQRAFNDPDTDVKTYQYVDTKKLMRPVYRIKQGTEGTSVAPEVDEGYVKLAEVVIRANNSTIEESDIKNITADIAGLENEDWTTEPDITYNIGYISDVNKRFRVAHNEDGTHKDDCINSDMLDIGNGSKQVNGNVLPVGGTVSIPTQTVSSTDSILSVLIKVAGLITTLYNAYLKYGTYGFNGELSISDIADENNELTKALKISAAGDGTALVKIGTDTILSIDANGKLTTNGYTATADNHIITKKVTDAISTALTALTTRVSNLETSLGNQEVYTNKVLSTSRLSVSTAEIAVATTADITLSAVQTIDGISLSAGQLVLVKDQSDSTENGIYTVQTSNWTRPDDYNTPAKIKGLIFGVTSGSVNAGKMYYTPTETFSDASSFGADDISFVEFLGSVNKLANKLVMRNSSGVANLDVIGNASTASALSTNKSINGLTFNSTENVTNYTACSTAAATAAKTVTCSGFVLLTGAEITVKFTVTNTADSPTLNVSDTGAKSIYYRGAAITAGSLAANRIYTFRYNGTQYDLVGDVDTTYGAATTAANGLMTSTDKTNLNNAIKSISRSGTTFTATRVSGGTFTFSQQDTTYGAATTAANGLMASTDKTNLNNAIKSISRSGTTFTATRVSGGTFTFSQQDNNTTYGAATTAAAGLMSASDKTKLDGIASGAQVNTVTGVKGNSESSYRTGAVNITPTNIGLGNVNNTADAAKAVLKAAELGVYTCSTASGTAAKTLAVSNFALYTGARLLVIFSNANTASSPTLNVNSTGALPITMGSGASSTTAAAASATNTAWNGIKASVLYDAYYDGTNWRLSAVNGNLCGIAAYYFSTSSGYIKYTNGLLIQWGVNKTYANVHEITLNVSYSNTDYVIMGMGRATSEYADANVYGYAVSANKIRLDTSNSKWKPYMYWFTIGY